MIIRLFPIRSIKMSILVLSYSVSSIKQQRFKAFTQAVFTMIEENFQIMIHPICIQPFTDFLRSYLSIFGSYWNHEQVHRMFQASIHRKTCAIILHSSYSLQIFTKHIFAETALVRHYLSQCVAYLAEYCVNHLHSVYSEIIKLTVGRLFLFSL